MFLEPPFDAAAPRGPNLESVRQSALAPLPIAPRFSRTDRVNGVDKYL